MSTPTVRATSRRDANAEQANRLATVYGWIRDHLNVLPTGWDVMISTSGRASMTWHSHDAERRLDILADLVEEFGEPDTRRNVLTDEWSYALWHAEGPRPELMVQRLPKIEVSA